MNDLTKLIDDDLPYSDTECLFCKASIGIGNTLRMIDDYGTASCFFDGFPVSRFHMLFVPKRHANDYFDLTAQEKLDIDTLIKKYSRKIMEKDSTVTGFNIGWNCGESAGQTIFHAHCHLIPRRDGDIDNPIGGVRGVIPEKRIY